MRRRLSALTVSVFVAVTLFCARPANADYYSCEAYPYLCLACKGSWLHKYCMYLPYGVMGACFCQDDVGCSVWGDFCMAIEV